MATNGTTTLSPETVERVLTLRPDLRDEIVKTLDQEIDQLEGMRDAFQGAKRRKPGSARARAPKGQHGEFVKKAMESLGATSKTKGCFSKDIKRTCKDKFDYEFGGSLGATLEQLCASGILGYEAVDKKAQRVTYRYWLAK